MTSAGFGGKQPEGHGVVGSRGLRSRARRRETSAPTLILAGRHDRLQTGEDFSLFLAFQPRSLWFSTKVCVTLT